MELKDILALRLRAMMDLRPDLDTQTKIHKKTGLSQSTVQRILARDVHTGLDVLQLLAAAFKVNPLDLIKPVQEADHEEHISPSYDELALLKAWRKLSDEDKHRAMAFISVSGETLVRSKIRARQIDADQSNQVPTNMVAANKRASGRKSAAETEIAVTPHGKEIPTSKGVKNRAS